MECPDLVMEICSSGGLRHEPLFVSLGSMVSFSDLHWTPEGAVVACDLHHIFLPRQMQIWSYIDPEHTEERIIYNMAQGMLGRLCLSGDIASSPNKIKALVKDGTAFYQKIKHVIKDGKTIFVDTEKVTSLRNLHSAFSLTRLSKDEKYALFYAFRVNGEEEKITGTLPAEYRVCEQYGNGKVETNGTQVIVYPTETNMFATVVLLERK